MLYLHQSNRIELLFTKLVEIQKASVKDVFSPEVVIVQSPGMENWLSRHIAEAQGIAANYRFEMPASFIWNEFREQLGDIPEVSAFDRQALLWACMKCLPPLLGSAQFSQVNGYLSGNENAIKLYQLCQRLAGLYYQYLIYRPDMIEEWEKGQEQDWQAVLWRSIKKTVNQSHRAELMGRYKERLRTGIERKGGLKHLSIFCVSSLAPAYLDVFNALSNELDVHFFLLNPCQYFWGDVQSEKDEARQRLKGRIDSLPSAPANDLLASFGKQSRDFFDQINLYEAHEDTTFFSPGRVSLLASVQSDILELVDHRGKPERQLIDSEDRSIHVHVCHSIMREVQVLHDYLLSMFSEMPDLRCQDVIVMAPDITGYNNAVDAVFGTAETSRRIPYRTASLFDISHHPLVQTVLEWILLPASRMSNIQVLDWLDLPAVQAAFDIDEVLYGRISDWISESEIRWGFDGQHKQSLDISADEVNTWSHGLKRIFVGYAMPDSSVLYEDIAPMADIEGSEVEALGSLYRFIYTLEKFSREFKQAVDISTWQLRINSLIDSCMQLSEKDELIIAHVRNAMAEILEYSNASGYDETIDYKVLHYSLSKYLSESSVSPAAMTSGVTFSSMIPMRSVPARVICLLGMNDADFPYQEQSLGFDLMSKSPRKGDYSRRSDDRSLFLESILASREILYLSYIGRDQKDNTVKPSSVLLEELITHIKQGYELANRAIDDHIVHEHSLQAFSPQAFKQGSYAAEWLRSKTDAGEFISEEQRLDLETNSTVQLSDLIEFLSNPSRFFMQRALGINYEMTRNDMEAHEPFELSQLDAYLIRDDVLDMQVEGFVATDVQTILQSQGRLPRGEIGNFEYQETTQHISEIVELVQARKNIQQDPIEVDIAIGAYQLQGWVMNYTSEGLFRYRPGKKRIADQQLLWIEHLVLCVLGKQTPSHFVFEQEYISIEPLAAEYAEKQLLNIIACYQQANQRLLPIFPNASYVYAGYIAKGKDAAYALHKAQELWEGSEYVTGDCDDIYVSNAFRGRNPFTDEFTDYAESLYLPIAQSIASAKGLPA